MNRADEFEQQLRSLKPTSPPVDEASVLYACGYAAGRKSVLNGSANGATWWKVAAAVLLASVLSGWGGYGMARRDVAEPQLAIVPAEIEQPPSVATERPLDPQPQTQTTDEAAAVEGDRLLEPVDSQRIVHWLPVPLDRFWRSHTAPAPSGDENGVVLTARSGSAEWTRWMEERPFVDRRQRTSTANEIDDEVSGEAFAEELTPMQWRRGDIDWKQWIH